MLCSLATKLSPEDLKVIADLEQDLGSVLLAFSCREDLKPAQLTAAQLAKIQALEIKMGLSLVAVAA